MSLQNNNLQRLIDGNKRFINGERSCINNISIETQKPFVAILSCSDSRVPLEIIFDQGFGDIFVARNAGNIACDNSIGSLEFAVQVLNVKLIIVMGHESCGAIQAAMQDVKSESDYLNKICQQIKPSIDNVNKELSNDLCHDITIENVKYNMQYIKENSKIVQNAINENNLSIYGGFYSIKSGIVSFF